jgi:hypothetical protein
LTITGNLGKRRKGEKKERDAYKKEGGDWAIRKS